MKHVAWVMGVAVVMAAAPAVWASDPIGVYARVDKVVLEPNEQNPERIQVWGAFALAVKGTPEEYAKPVEGYLYYTMPKEKADLARKEWSDLKKVAGTAQCVGFASRYKPTGTVRKADAQPKDPDPYPLQYGLTKVNESNPQAKLLKKSTQ